MRIHSVAIKFPNWCHYSKYTNDIYRWWTGLFRETVYLYDVQVSTSFVDAYEEYNYFYEVLWTFKMEEKAAITFCINLKKMDIETFEMSKSA
jgi:hypothetical protein